LRRTRTLPQIWLFTDERLDQPTIPPVHPPNAAHAEPVEAPRPDPSKGSGCTEQRGAGREENGRGSALLRAVARLPRGQAGVILRHHAAPGRAGLGRRLRALTRRRRLILLVADDARLACALHADGVHHSRAARTARTPGLRTATAHTLPELRAAERARTHLAFLSPVFATRTHPGAPALGPVRFGLLARAARIPVAALGGLTSARYRRMKPLGAIAWGAIDAHA
jgi:thiamine-phosphate pyrophosphorylase